jgi:hypothetical protein
METTTHESDMWKLTLTGGKVSGDITWTSEEHKDTLEVAAKFKGQKPKKKGDEDKAVSDMSTLWKSMKGGDVGKANYELLVKQAGKWAENAGKSWADSAIDYKEVFGASDFVSIGVKFVWKDGKYDKCQLSLGYEAKIEASASIGVVSGKMSMATGTKITWDI